MSPAPPSPVPPITTSQRGEAKLSKLAAYLTKPMQAVWMVIWGAGGTIRKSSECKKCFVVANIPDCSGDVRPAVEWSLLRRCGPQECLPPQWVGDCVQVAGRPQGQCH